MSVGIENIEQTCDECGQCCCNRRSLGNHVNRSHRELGGLQGYVLKHKLQGIVPKCKCGCGKDALWHKLLYKYNDYLTGHNRAGFVVNQPTFTPEQIEKRNEAIRKAYSERGEEISKKISKAVTEGLANSSYDFSERSNRQWADEEFRKVQHDARVKSWQGKEGIIRRKKVFTPEFGKKISEANMRRDAKCVSKVELVFFDKVKAIIPDAEHSKWFNFSERTWCVDVWLPTQKTMIEIDGTYWHGLDRTSDFTHDQLVNVTNDICKNKIAREKKLTLLRINESSCVSDLTSFEDLVSLSYHTVVEGNVLKEGTFKIEDDTVIISRSTLLGMSEEHKRSLIKVFADLLRAYVSYWGWFYPSSKYTLEHVLEHLSQTSSTERSLTSSTWLKSFVKSYWNVENGPVTSFFDDDALKSVLSYRLGLNNSKMYEYKLNDGSVVQSRETFDMNLINIRRGFVVQRKAVSWFKPAIAAFIFKTFLQDNAEPVVWDPSIGFSARMLGFAGSFERGTYVGTDPASAMYDDAVLLSAELTQFRSNMKFELHKLGSEVFCPQQNSIDLVFTSPPYFDTEKYCNEEGQCWRDYPSLDQWEKYYLLPTIKNAFTALKKGCKLVLNVSQNLVELVERVACSIGFTRRSDIDLALQLNSDHFMRVRGKTAERSEPVIVFEK